MTASMPTVAQILRYWSGRHLPGTDCAPVLDIGEPSCFACSWYSTSESKPMAHGLERAHAMPKSIGGSNEPSNLALLCKRCHLDAPDTADVAWFWQWVATHPHDGDPLGQETARFASAVAMLEPDQAATLATLGQAELARLLEEAAPAVQPVHHNGRFSAPTVARLMVEMTHLARLPPGQVALDFG